MSFEVLLAMVFLVAWRGVQHGWERKGFMDVSVCVYMGYGLRLYERGKRRLSTALHCIGI